MKRIVQRILWTLTLIGGLPLAVQAEEFFKIDPTHTYPHFAISHLGFSTLYGRFNQTSGSFMIDWERGTGSVDVKIAAVSIDTGFKKRDDHLRSPDFLNVMEFPEIRYRSTRVTLNGKESAVIEGELTLHGVTKPVTIHVDHIHCGTNPINNKYTCGFNGRAKIKRSDFGITYALPAVGDEMDLWFEVEGQRE